MTVYVKYTAIVYIALTNSLSARPELGYREVIVSLFVRLSHQWKPVSSKDQLIFDEIAIGGIFWSFLHYVVVSRVEVPPHHYYVVRKILECSPHHKVW